MRTLSLSFGLYSSQYTTAHIEIKTNELHEKDWDFFLNFHIEFSIFLPMKKRLSCSGQVPWFGQPLGYKHVTFTFPSSIKLQNSLCVSTAIVHINSDY